MNKLFKKIGIAFVGIAMAVGVGVAIGSKEAKVASAADQTDNLTASLFTATNTTYKAFSGVSATSDAVYAGTTAKTSGGGIQIRSKSSDTGIITTGSGGNLKSISIVIESGSNTIDFYGKTSAYSSVGDLYGSNKGTKIGSASATGSVTLTNPENYTYLGIRSNSGACYITSISITWTSASTPLTGITLSGSEVGGASPNYTLANIAKSDTSTNHTVSVGLTPTTATDQKVKIEHYDGDNVVDIYSSPVTCTSGTGSFNVRAKGTAVGTERLKIYGNTETSVVRYLSVTVYDDSVTNWTVSFNSDGGATIADMTVEDGETFEFPSPGTKTHYSFDGWSSDGGNTLYDAGEESPAVDDDIEYTAYWTEDDYYTVTYSAGPNGSGTYSHTHQYGGAYTLLAFANLSGVSASSGYRFKNYTVGGVDKNPDDTFTLSAATTVTVNFEELPPTDTLTADIIGQTSYGDWSGKSGGASDAVYAGNSTKSSDGAIQMRSSNSNSGIVTTTSGGTITAVTVTWNKTEAPTTARTLDIYAKTTAYSSASDLYAAGTQGTKVGSISYTNTTTYQTTLTITGDYTYVGVRSNSGALYLDDISFEWELPNQLSSIVISGYDDEFDSGDTFTFGGTVTAKYTKASDATVTSSATFHLDSASGTSMSGVTLTHAAHDGHTIYVKYTEGGITKTATYEISVSNAPVSSVTIGTHAAEIGLGQTYSVSGITPTVLPADAIQTTEWVVSANTVSDDYTFNGTTLTAKTTEGTVTLRCRSTVDNSKYDELVVDITGNPTAAFDKASTSGYVGKSEVVYFTYSSMDDTELIEIESGNTSYVTVADDMLADDGEGLVTINFVGAGSTTVTISYDGGSALASLTVTVSADSVISVSWEATNFDVFSGTTLTSDIDNTWLASYEMASGDEGLLEYGDYILKLGGTPITLPHTWVAADSGKNLWIEYGGVSSSTVSVTVTQSINNVYADVTTETTYTFNSLSWGDAANEWSGTKNGNGFTEGQGVQVTTSQSGVVVTGETSHSNIAKIIVTYNTNKSAGVGAIAIKVGDNASKSQDASYQGGGVDGRSANYTAIYNYGNKQSGTIEMTVTTTTNSLWIKSITVVTATGVTTQIANNASHKAAQRVAVNFANAFNAAMDETENCTTGLDDAWSTCSAAYTTFLSEAAALGETEEAWALNLVKYATAQYSDDSAEACIERMMKTYEICVQKHGKTAFMSDLKPLDAQRVVGPIALVNKNTNTVLIIAIVSVITTAAIGGYFFLRKRKED